MGGGTFEPRLRVRTRNATPTTRRITAPIRSSVGQSPCVIRAVQSLGMKSVAANTGVWTAAPIAVPVRKLPQCRSVLLVRRVRVVIDSLLKVGTLNLARGGRAPESVIV